MSTSLAGAVTALPPPPSPARSANPFAARAAPSPVSASSFSRASLLPSISPARPTAAALSTPVQQAARSVTGGSGVTASGKRQAWRLLWRGGLEIGADGWRLDGITFFALLDFPATPLAPTPNPFDAPPFASGADTDLCLSLESMRGRKYLHVRDVVALDDDELEHDDGHVQLSISPHAPLLAGYFTHLLCRGASLTAQGRTNTAVRIGLGDEGVDAAHNTLYIFGQRQPGTSSLRLCVGRRRPPAAAVEAKVRPGEPLPRPPLFFPDRAPSKPPPPFPRRSLAPSRSFSRAPSTSSIYALPPALASLQLPHPQAQQALPPAPRSGRTPGRRGEKRPRQMDADDERRRKAGRIVLERKDSNEGPSRAASWARADDEDDAGKDGLADESEDIFGKRPVLKDEQGADPPSTTAGRTKRVRVPQQVLDNKAAVRKVTMARMEQRGCAREHYAFKDVFGMATRGAYFAFPRLQNKRDTLEAAPLDKGAMVDIVDRHLDMYLPAPTETPPRAASDRTPSLVSAGIDTSTPSIKEEYEGEDEDVLVKIEHAKEEEDAEVGVYQAGGETSPHAPDSIDAVKYELSH